MPPTELDLPAELPQLLDENGSALREPAEVMKELRLGAALFLFEHGRISAGRAAEVAGLSRAEFIDACDRIGVAVVNYDAKDLKRELDSLGLRSGGKRSA